MLTGLRSEPFGYECNRELRQLRGGYAAVPAYFTESF